MDPVVRGVGPFPLDEAAQRANASEALLVAVDEIRVVRDVGHDLGAGAGESGVPLGLDRSGKLHEVKAPAGKRLDRRAGGGAGLGLVAPRVEHARVQEDEVLLVACLRSARLDQGRHSRGIGLEKLEGAVVGDQRRAGRDQLARQDRIADADFSSRAPGERSGGQQLARDQQGDDAQEHFPHVEPRSLGARREGDPETGEPLRPAGPCLEPGIEGRVCADSERNGSDLRHTALFAVR
jgi:hypothetical protein